ncbi:MAG: tetratricopeptide repeat protein [Bacteroidales bacterium]|nr:tetratricopeptide repeat protein [Bacteroidales bacterium]
MKRFLILSIVMMLGIMLSAQTQQGYVKTKGRMVNGKLVHGQGLKGATVSVHGRTAVLVNKDDGAFSFPIPEKQFRLDSVRKKGYQLVDLDALGKTYKHSSNPLYLVMETPEQQLLDQLAAERKIRRTLTNQLHQREDEIEALKALQKLSDEEYRQALQKLYEDTDQNEQLVKDMMERYSKIDYDQLSEFDQRISELILNGELTKADSMLRTKGDINERISQYKKHEAINVKERNDLSQRMEQLEQSETLAQKELEDLANDCYRKFEIFKMQHLNDSAAYYIELRAGLDSTNLEWLNEAGNFLYQYMADNSKALSFFQVALRQTEKLSGEEKAWAGTIYNNIGLVYSGGIGDYDKALEYYKKALAIEETIFGESHPEVAASYNNIGVAHYHQGDFQKALEYFDKAMTLQEATLGESNPDLATTYNNIGTLYSDLNDNEKGLVFLKKALSIRETSFGRNHPDVAASYNNIGCFYHDQRDYDQALEYLEQALSIRETIFGKNHPDVATSYNNIATSYKMLYNFDKAWSYYQEALSIGEAIYGEFSPFMAACYDNIGTLCYAQGDYTKALEYVSHALSIRNIILKENHPDIATCYNQIGNIYSSLGDYKKAKDYLTHALTIRKAVFGENNNKVAKSLNNIAMLCYEIGDYNTAIDYLEQALSIRKAIFGEDHQITIDQQQQLNTCKYWIAVKNDTVNTFCREYCITATVANDETAAARQGMSGEYVLLEYEDWNQDSPTSVFDTNEALKGKPKDILVMKDANIEKHHFENTIGIIISVKHVGKNEKQRINKAYEEWKEKNSPKSSQN